MIASSAFTVGVLMSLFALLPMVLAVSAGRWIDRVGPRRPLALGLSLLAADAAPGDAILAIGAGSVNQVLDRVAELLGKKDSTHAHH